MGDDDKNDPWAGFPGGNPFGPGGPFGGRDPFANMDEFFRSMGIDPGEFQRLFADMQKNLQDALKDLSDDPSKGFVQGFSFRMGPDGKPHFSSFGNKPRVDAGEGALPGVNADQREPLTDVIEDAASIAVTMELPGVEKQDINLQVTEDRLEITVDNERRKYHKRVRLPSKVDPKTTKATYNNGILDVTVQKMEKDDEGVRVNIE